VYIYDNSISLNSSQNENVTDKGCGTNQNTHALCMLGN